MAEAGETSKASAELADAPLHYPSVFIFYLFSVFLCVCVCVGVCGVCIHGHLCFFYFHFPLPFVFYPMYYNIVLFAMFFMSRDGVTFSIYTVKTVISAM